MAEKRRKYSPKKIIRLLLVLALIAFLAVRGCSKDEVKVVETKPTAVPGVHLNDTLTNEMSTRPETADMDEVIERYLQRWEIVGAQLAVSRGDTLVFAKGYGWAEKEKNERMTPRHILRIASVSKLLTAVGIMKLKEEGRLSLSDHVFGPNGILNDTAYTSVIRDKRHFDITVEHLLRHQAGFTNYAGDPMFSTRYIMMQNHLTVPPDHPTLLKIVLHRRLGYAPGTSQRYSNLGYTLLSLIIERKTGMKYEEFMQKEIFHPAGCYGLALAGNYYADKKENEVKYYMHSDAEPIYEFNNSGKLVVKCYGENDIPRLLGAGAWCASAAELCHFIAAIDGIDAVPDILSKESVAEMTREMSNYGFSIGWNKTPEGKPWTRTGTLSGSSALVVKYPDGQCWVFLTNTSTWKGQGFAKDTMALFEKLRQKYSALLRPILPTAHP